MNKEYLIEFENKIALLFNNAKIRAPIHLYSGNEEQMLKVFERIDIKNDWVLCTWRNHYQALCKGIPPKLLENKIIQGKSMVMNLPKYKFICSSIVGGIPSIATGIALGLKEKNSTEHVWCWVGDMSAETGAFHEAYKYSVNNNLPITFIVEDNRKSVLTPTPEIWKRDVPYYLEKNGDWVEQPHLIYYKYENNKYPHAGAGIRVQF